MRLFAFPLLAVSSLALVLSAFAETRPQYRGTLQVQTRIAPTSLDPSDAATETSIPRRNLTRLIFETLVVMDTQGRARPGLATSWQAESGNQRWQFWLRTDVKFHDGSPMTADAVAASLRLANPGWRIYPASGWVIIERDSPSHDLPADLACARNAIAKRNGSPVALGTGPFHVTTWEPGKRLVLGAEEDYWGGRPFLDSIEIEMGKGEREQMIALELGKASVVEVPAEQAHRATLDGRRVVTSAPAELVALVFSKDPRSSDEEKLRDALAASIDRASIRNVVLQGVGEPTAALLPNWMTGYAFLFAADQNLALARQKRAEVAQGMTWTLGYDSNDSLARLIAERVALNARDAGLTVTTTSANADANLMRIPLASVSSRVALAGLTKAAGLPAPQFANTSSQDLYKAESAALLTHRVIPLFFLPASYVLGPTVRGFSLDRIADWNLPSAWLEGKEP